MQAYSIVKGKSRSDDGNERFPEYLVGERKTISDDGFESFPEYRFDSKIQSYEGEKLSEHCDDDPQIRPNDSTTEKALPRAIAKREKRRLIQRNKRRNRKGKAADAEKGTNLKTLEQSYKAPGVESDDEADVKELANNKDDEELLSRTSLLNLTSDRMSAPKTMIKVAEDEEFEFGAEEADFIERFKKMTAAQQRMEMEKVLGSLL